MSRTATDAWDILRQFPPAVVRLTGRRIIAGKNVRALANQEVAIASGIPLVRIVEISFSLSWEDIAIGEAERFCGACGFDPTCAEDRRRQREYIRICLTKYPHRPPHYLTSSPYWESQLRPIITHIKSRTDSSINSIESRLR